MSEPAPYPAFDGTQVCAQTDPEAWFPEVGGQAVDARRMCSSCRFQPECFEYSLWHDVMGVWGGGGRRERDEARRERGIVPLPLGTSPLAQMQDTIRGLVAAGYEPWEIAVRTGVSDRTAERHAREFRESRGAA